jgi:hypothetical protein
MTDGFNSNQKKIQYIQSCDFYIIFISLFTASITDSFDKSFLYTYHNKTLAT